MAENLLDRVLKGIISPDQFEKEIWTISTGVKRTGRGYNGSKEDPIRLFRSRVFNSTDLPNTLNEYSYPPAKFCNLGRANEKNIPVFYASAGGPTTFIESRCKIGDIIVLSEYRCTNKLIVQKVGFSNKLGEESEFERTIHEIFTHLGDKYYEYSSKIASHLMRGDQLHGITYPSIISRNQSQNLAIKIDYADEFLSLMHCTAYKINSIKNQFKYDVEEFNFGVNEENSINWKGRKKRWELKEQDAELKWWANGWQWEAYDVNNKLVDPE